MFYIEDRHDYPHAKREVEGRGVLRSYDPYCAECARVGFCTWCQGPCKVDGPALTVPAAFAKLRENPFELLANYDREAESWANAGQDEAEYVDDEYVNEFSQDSDEPAGPIFSWTTACPTCGEVHPV